MYDFLLLLGHAALYVWRCGELLEPGEEAIVLEADTRPRWPLCIGWVGRWTAGERVIIVPNDYPEKYCYLVEFDPYDDGMLRRYYMYRHQISSEGNLA